MGVQPSFYDHEIVQKAPDEYVEMHLAPSVILKAWQKSMFAHELLTKEGGVREQSELSDVTLQKFVEVAEAFKRGEDVPKPIIGIGMMDNIEIGLGREVVCMAQVNTMPEIPIHCRKAQVDEIKNLL